MQVYVKRAKIATDPVGVVGLYPDEPMLAIDIHGSDSTRLLFPAGVVFPRSQNEFGQVLPANWRSDHKITIINGEANRRILIVFPEFKQRNSTTGNLERTQMYGSDVNQWPANEKAWHDEYARGWTYVLAVRDQSNVLSAAALPTDPTDDSNWPSMIPPVNV